ncbi:hypothetical protein QBC43DRAFT_305506 [Cladorrhinum sp. PSN259]|nr:hypothetical protein QBC43DRAFT_305506 [Cladorrhinum sp. PSN259]
MQVYSTARRLMVPRARVLRARRDPFYTSYLAPEGGDEDDGLLEIDPGSYDLKTQMEMLSQQASASIKIIKADDAASELRIRGSIKGTTSNGLQQISRMFVDMALCAQGPEIWKPTVLLNPAHDGEGQFTAVFHPDQTDGTRRPIATVSKYDLAINADYLSALSKTLDNTLANLRYDPNRLRMRVNFGKIALSQWRKGKIEYSFGDLERALRVAGTRDCISLTGRVPMDPIETLRVALSARDHTLPKVILDSLEFKKPELNLYVMSKNLAIQCPLEPVTGRERYTTNKVGGRKADHYAIGSLTGHQMDKTNKKVTIITSCPESPYDWEIEITREIKRAEAQPVLPFTSQTLGKFTQFTGETLQGEFPKVRLLDSFIKEYEVSDIYGKATWTYPLSMQYELEISIFHLWGTDTSKQADTVATISLNCRDWDDNMTVPRRLPREWNRSFATQFLSPYDPDEIPEPSSRGDHPLSHFLAWVHWVNKTLNGMQLVTTNHN